MFGSNDNQQNTTSGGSGVNPPDPILSAPSMPPASYEPIKSNTTSSNISDPLATNTKANSAVSDGKLSETDYIMSPVSTTSTSQTFSPSSKNEPTATAASSPVDNDLLSIKQEALSHLQPLVSHIKQSPEDKFQTLMMMIQASDNQSLVKDAYEAAKQITNEETRAKALLDIVNEINYFTSQSQKELKD